MKEFKSFLKMAGGSEGSRCKYPLRLDTYGCGCSHDCNYCYAKSLLDFRKLWNPEDPSVANFKKIFLAIKKIDRVVRLGGMTDCFAPIERKHGVTKITLQFLNSFKKPYLIVTKSDLVADDSYIEVLDKKLAHIQISVTSTDDEISLKNEKACVPSKRIAAIEKLSALGYDVSIRVSPYVPEWIDVGRINDIKCEKLLVEFLRVNSWIKKWMDLDFSEYTLKEGGYLHLPLEKKIELLKGFKKSQLSVCEDVDSHYEYWKENVNVNKEDCCNLRLE
jgi:DNA repair photolyase